MKHQEIIASREAYRISTFLDQAVTEGRMNQAEKAAVEAESAKVLQDAGHLDGKGGIKSGGEEQAAVWRHANHLAKRKLAELRPELAEELTRFIEHRAYHPLPEVPPHLAKPGVALAEYRSLLAFIDDKRRDGGIPQVDAYAMYEPAIRLFEDAGIYMGSLNEQTDKAVLVQAAHLVRKKLVELHPELSEAAKNLGPTRDR